MKQQTKFKQTEVGMIPEDWELTEFLKLLSEKTRNGIYKQKQFHGKGVKIINMKELFAYSRIGNQDMKRVRLNHSEMSRFLVHKGDLLFARRSLVAEGSGKCSLIVEHSEPMTFESSMILARPDKKVVDPEFLYYFFSSPKGHQIMGAILRQVAVAGITGSDLMKLKIIKPPIPEQQSIAKILSDLDLKIELNQQMNKTLEAICKAIFRHWFVDFEFPNEQGKPYKSSGGEMVYNEELAKEIPKGWKVSVLADYLSVLETGSRPKGGVKHIEQGIPSIGAESITRIGDFDFSATKFVDIDFFESMGKGLVENGDILLYKDGGKPGEHPGRKTMVDKNFPFDCFCINEHVYRLRIHTPLTQHYLYFWLETPFATEQIIQRATGVAQPGLNREAVESIPVLTPTPQIISKFTTVIQPLCDRMFENGKESHSLALIRDSLLPKLMSGKIRVPVEVK